MAETVQLIEGFEGAHCFLWEAKLDGPSSRVRASATKDMGGVWCWFLDDGDYLRHPVTIESLEYCWVCLWYRPSVYASEQWVCAWYEGETLIAHVRVDPTTHNLRFYRGASTLFTHSAVTDYPLTLGRTYKICIQIRFNSINTVSYAWVDGIPTVRNANDPTDNPTRPDTFQLGGSGTVKAYYDNIILGTKELDRRALYEILGIIPSSAGSYGQWTPSSGANWAAAGNVPMEDSYVATNTSGLRDSYNVNAPSQTLYYSEAYLQVQAHLLADGTPTPQAINLSYTTDDTITDGADQEPEYFTVGEIGCNATTWDLGTEAGYGQSTGFLDDLEIGIRSRAGSSASVSPSTSVSASPSESGSASPSSSESASPSASLSPSSSESGSPSTSPSASESASESVSVSSSPSSSASSSPSESAGSSPSASVSGSPSSTESGSPSSSASESSSVSSSPSGSASSSPSSSASSSPSSSASSSPSSSASSSPSTSASSSPSASESTSPSSSPSASSSASTPTRFYLPSDGSIGIPTPAIDAEWDQTTGTLTRLWCDTEKQNTEFSTRMPNKLDPTSTPWDNICRQYISYRQLAAQTISGTVKGQMLVEEQSSAYDQMSAVSIRVVSSDGNTVRGTLLSYFEGSLSHEWDATILVNRGMPPETALTPVEAQDGDRLVIEIGSRAFAGGSGSHYIYMRIGDAAASDLPENETSTDDYNPWIEFDSEILFLNPSESPSPSASVSSSVSDSPSTSVSGSPSTSASSSPSASESESPSSSVSESAGSSPSSSPSASISPSASESGSPSSSVSASVSSSPSASVSASGAEDLFRDGGEDGVGQWDEGSQPTLVTTDPTPYEGTYCLQANSCTKSGFSENEIWGQLRFYCTNGSAAYIMYFMTGSDGVMGGILKDANEFISIRRGSSTVIATGTADVALNTWHLIEFHYLPLDSGGRWEVRVDGGASLDIDYTGDTVAGSPPLAKIVLGGSGTYYDNIVLSDTGWPTW